MILFIILLNNLGYQSELMRWRCIRCIFIYQHINLDRIQHIRLWCLSSNALLSWFRKMFYDLDPELSSKLWIRRIRIRSPVQYIFVQCTCNALSKPVRFYDSWQKTSHLYAAHNVHQGGVSCSLAHFRNHFCQFVILLRQTKTEA